MKTELRLLLLVPALAFFLAGCAGASAPRSQERTVQGFIHTMAIQHGFNPEKLNKLLAQAHVQQSILQRMTHPAESMPWYAYRPIFMGKKRIAQGVSFLHDHRRSLEKAYRRYGVPANVITAILGVETFYGQRQGKIRVLDSLYTLAFHYPPRSRFFTSELEQFLLLTREQKINPLTVKGSYAGAMGQAQFIASSYRHYAVDFNNNGKCDLWHESADAIGSVAHYLAQAGWEPGQPIAIRANVSPNVSPHTLKGLKSNELKTRYTVAGLTADGIRPQRPLPEDLPVGLLRLQGKAVPAFWLGAHNFYVITQYNHSPLYAMAVYQLATAISRSAARDHAQVSQR